MYKIALFFLFIRCSFSAFSQSDNPERLSVGVYMPIDRYDDLEYGQIRKLETQIINIIANNGITSKISAFRIQLDNSGTINQNLLQTMAKGIVCLPKFEIYGDRTADTGMKKIQVVDVSLTLTIQYIYEDIIFSTLSMQLQGSGNTRAQAINNTIRNIRSGDSRWAKFLDHTREEIVRYYDAMCDKLMQQAHQLNKLDLTTEALAILWPIPKEVACHEMVEELTVDIYRKHINRECRKQIQIARGLLAANRYDEGLSILMYIDPGSECARESEELTRIIEKEFDENAEKNRNSELMLRREELRLEELRYKNIETMVAKHKEPTFKEKVLVIK